jgi:HlyD family secretion protein
MKKIVIAVIVVAIGVAAFLILRGRGGNAEPKFITAEVQKGTISIMVTATGTLEAVTTVQVGSQVSGTISALYADFNDTVKKGEIVAQLDPTFLQAQVAQAQADLDQAMASAELSKREYERSIRLFDENMISEAERDITLTNYELAKTRQKSVEAALDRVKTNLEYATITSPIDGVVISRNVDVGQTVAASLQAPTLFTIAQDLTQMQVKASIDEADIGRIVDGQAVVFTVDAYPERSFKGAVRQIRLSPQIVQNVVSYDVIITVPNPEMVLKPGMTANVTVLIDHRQDVLKVPAAALRFRPQSDEKKPSADTREAPAGARAAQENGGPPEGGMKKKPPTVLWVLDTAGNPQPIPVETGLSDGTFTEIMTASLKAGDSIVVGQRGVAAPANNDQVNPFAPRFPGSQRGGGTRRSG